MPTLYLVPAGRRLDFPTPSGHYADVYRRIGNQPWECVAHHACSPYLDRPPLDTNAEYYIQYRDAQNGLVSCSTVVTSAPEGIPTRTCWLRLSQP
ncbi:hypothetical protein HER32_11285 [Hymenobacter sp. BT18]|uniref:hypothetical protein n=1 Tax=Hymenobacter sp. BT18 TaxID=2835648 RepID=UPI00143E316B|nr:hypothetical protein [Hymenobacter sp. BT18]QIX61728.1 hypothetical protein HER32_11285 [Hymenobacter sp. BT18]